MNNVLVVASIRTGNELNWVKAVIEKHRKGNIWLVVDKKSTEILARSNMLSRIGRNNVMVFAGKKPEELVLRIFKATTPDIVYLCDEYNALKMLVDFFKVAPVKTIEC